MNIYRLLLIVLSLISAWLYLRVVLPPEPVVAETADQTTPAASGEMATTEAAGQTAAPTEPATDEPAPQTAASTTGQSQGETAPAAESADTSQAEDLRPLPADQMRQIIETLAPELLQGQ